METIFYIKKGEKTNKIKPRYFNSLDKIKKVCDYGSEVVRFCDIQKWCKSKGHWNLDDKERRYLEVTLNEFGFKYSVGFNTESAQSCYIELNFKNKVNKNARKRFLDFYINL